MSEKCPHCGEEFTPIEGTDGSAIECIQCGVLKILGQNKKIVDATGHFIDALNCLCEAGDYSARDVMDVFLLAFEKIQDISYAKIGLGIMLGCLDVLFPDKKGITDLVRQKTQNDLSK